LKTSCCSDKTGEAGKRGTGKGKRGIRVNGEKGKGGIRVNGEKGKGGIRVNGEKGKGGIRVNGEMGKGRFYPFPPLPIPLY
jgi:hypothetical protein